MQAIPHSPSLRGAQLRGIQNSGFRVGRWIASLRSMTAGLALRSARTTLLSSRILLVDHAPTLPCP